MTPQPVVIHGTRCVLRKTGGGGLTSYVVTGPGGAVLTQQPSRFLAVAKAAQVLHTPRT